MYFRLRGNNAQIIKTVKDGAGKTKATSVGSVNLLTEKQTLKENATLTGPEKKLVENWLKSQRELNKLEAELASKTLGRKIQQVASNVQSGLVEISDEQFEDISLALRQLKTAVRRSNKS